LQSQGAVLLESLLDGELGGLLDGLLGGLDSLLDDDEQQTYAHTCPRSVTLHSSPFWKTSAWRVSQTVSPTRVRSPLPTITVPV
jgi:hypothetical protein